MFMMDDGLTSLAAGTQDKSIRGVRLHVAGALMLLSLLLLVHPGSAATESEAAPAGPQQEQSQSAEESDAKKAKCYHGCRRWGQRCNIDPLGRRTCRRTCEQFGEICE